MAGRPTARSSSRAPPGRSRPTAPGRWRGSRSARAGPRLLLLASEREAPYAAARSMHAELVALRVAHDGEEPAVLLDGLQLGRAKRDQLGYLRRDRPAPLLDRKAARVRHADVDVHPVLAHLRLGHGLEEDPR